MWHIMNCACILLALIHIRVGHAYAEYAVHADDAHMREDADADGDENLIHII